MIKHLMLISTVSAGIFPAVWNYEILTSQQFLFCLGKFLIGKNTGIVQL